MNLLLIRHKNNKYIGIYTIIIDFFHKNRHSSFYYPNYLPFYRSPLNTVRDRPSYLARFTAEPEKMRV